MANKTQVQTFTTGWDKIVGWAKSQNIPYTAYYPVYQLDSQRLVQGQSPLSDAERINAIKSAQGLDATTSLPTDAPSPFDITQNVKTNAADIFTGLNPVSLVKNIFDTVTNAFEHPSSVYNAFTGGGLEGIFSAKGREQFSNTVLAQHSLLSLIPGVNDLAEAYRGKAGFDQLAQNPLSSILDVLPVGKIFSKLGAKLPISDEVAQKLGVSKEELSNLLPSQIGWRLLKQSPAGSSAVHLAVDAQGNTDLVPFTIGDRITKFRNHFGAGAEQGDLLKGLMIHNARGTELVQQIAGPAIEAIGSLSKEDATIAHQIIQSDHRSPNAILHDDSIPRKIRTALEPVFNWQRLDSQIKMQAGGYAEVYTPYGVERYNVTPGSAGASVLKARDKSEIAQENLDKASKEFDYTLKKQQDNDVALNNYVQRLHTLSDQVYQIIKRSIPNLPADAADRARSTLTQEERWDRSVAHQGPVLHNLLGLPPEARISMHHFNALQKLFAPGSLIDLMYQAYENEDWISLNKYSAQASRLFENKIFQTLPSGTNDILRQIKALTLGMHKFSEERRNITERLTKIWDGKYRGNKMGKAKYQQSIAHLSTVAQKAHDDFLKVALHNPPDLWDNTYLEILTDKLINSEHLTELGSQVEHSLAERGGWPEDSLNKLRSDPRTILELVFHSARASLENGMLPDIDYELVKRYSEDAYHELSILRATGEVPHYIPSLTSADKTTKTQLPAYDIHIGPLSVKADKSLKSRLYSYKDSVFDIQLGVLKSTKDRIEQDVTQAYHDEYVQPKLYKSEDIRNLAMSFLHTQLSSLAQSVADTGVRQATVDHLISQQIREWNLVPFDATATYGSKLGGQTLGGDHYIDADLSKALGQSISDFTLPAKGIIEKGTKIFRFSILGLSPRYTAHILFGGTYLIALRGHPSMFKFIGEGVRFARTGEFSQEVMAKFPSIHDAIEHSATQEGSEDIVFHYFGGQQMGNLLIQEWMSKHPHVEGALGKIQAASNINMRFTRAVVRAQKAVTYLDGAQRALKTGEFYETDYVPRIDPVTGKQALNPITHKPLFDEKRVLKDMTPQQIHEEGMKAVESVMGDLRHMTPLERGIFTKVFPFYGWTKHILTYVLTYPQDHPWRASILSQLAEQDSQSVPSGLPTRIQLLFFLGQPDAYGNVTALDTKALDPLRDTANYASFTGLFESLNPAATSVIGLVDPNITYGQNNPYPTLTYDQLYGTTTAGPTGSAWTFAEQYVPQLNALDAAFNLSGQYSYLKSQGGTAFTKKLFESLNLPFTPQNINLRQEAAKGELDRYRQAEGDAAAALKTGDFSALDQYPSSVPDPLNPLYNVTPAYLAALYNYSEDKYGLPPDEALPRPPNPPI